MSNLRDQDLHPSQLVGMAYTMLSNERSEIPEVVWAGIEAIKAFYVDDAFCLDELDTAVIEASNAVEFSINKESVYRAVQAYLLMSGGCESMPACVEAVADHLSADI